MMPTFDRVDGAKAREREMINHHQRTCGSGMVKEGVLGMLGGGGVFVTGELPCAVLDKDGMQHRICQIEQGLAF